MLKYIVKRLIALIPVIFIISIVLFGMLKAMPGDPVLRHMPIDETGTYNDPVIFDRVYAETAARLGYDQPIPVQYVRWAQRTLQGNFGNSTQYVRPVVDVVANPLRNSLILNIGSTILAFLISIVIGIKSAVRQGKLYDRFWQVMSMIGYSLPTFFIAMILIFVFAQKLGWFPSASMPPTSIFRGENGDIAYFLEWARILVLPTITLTIGSFASTSRYVRNAMIESLSQDYIRTARSKGVSERKVVYSHAFRNALIPVVTVVAWGIAGMFGGAAITERMFSFEGIGNYLITGVINKDYDVVLAMNMFYTLIALSANMVMDVGYALVDPRIRLD